MNENENTRIQNPRDTAKTVLKGKFIVTQSCCRTQFCCCRSITQLCSTLCNPMDCSMLGFAVHHHLPELAQTHIHWVSDAIRLSDPLSSPSTPTFKLSQHQCLFQWVSSSHQMAKVLELQLQHQFFQWICRNWFPLGWTGWISLQSKDSQESSPTPQLKGSVLRCSAFFTVQLSHPINDYWKNHSFNYMDLGQQSNVSAFNTILTSGYKENFK